MTIIADLTSLNGQRALIEAKMKEFEGMRLIGDMATAETIREQAHALLDAWFDGQASLAENLRRGRYS